MNLSTGQAASRRGDNNNSGGGGTLRGAFDAAPANSLTVGAVGFGPAWNDEPSLRELYDTACASIVRAECEADELRAEVAMLKQGMLLLAKERDIARNGETIEEWDHWRTAGERDEWRECAEKLRAEVAMLQEQARIISQERDEARVQYRSTHALAESLVKTIGELKAERVELKATINTYRDEACRESCRDKAQADGGWANI
jgi:cell division protein FtsB